MVPQEGFGQLHDTHIFLLQAVSSLPQIYTPNWQCKSPTSRFNIFLTFRHTQVTVYHLERANLPKV